MAIIYWTNGAGGDFGTATNWSSDTVPGASDQARIDDGSGATVSANETVLSLATNTRLNYLQARRRTLKLQLEQSS
jgi:hypothetical protein